MRTKIFSLLLVVALMGLTAISFASEEEIPGASKRKLQVKVNGRVQVKYETDLGSDTNEYGNSGSGFAARRLFIAAKATYGKEVAGQVYYNALGNSIVYGWLSTKLGPAPLTLSLGLKNIKNTLIDVSSGVLLHGDSGIFNAYLPQTMFGANLSGSFAKMMHVNLYFTNAGQTALTGGDSTSNSWKHYGFGLNLRITPLGKWSQGKEWLQNKKMKAYFGLGVYIEGSRPTSGTTTAAVTGTNTAALGRLSNLMVINAEAGFTASLLYFQAGVQMANGGLSSAAGTKYDAAPSFSYSVDLAATINKNIVPALRLQHHSGSIVARDTGGTQHKQTNLHFTVNVFPYGLGHGFKLQPELVVELIDRYINTNNNSDTTLTDKNAKFRLTATLNF